MHFGVQLVCAPDVGRLNMLISQANDLLEQQCTADDIIAATAVRNIILSRKHKHDASAPNARVALLALMHTVLCEKQYSVSSGIKKLRNAESRSSCINRTVIIITMCRL